MKYYFYFLLILVFVSCEIEKELDYLTRDYEPKLILHGFISPQDGVDLVLKRTLSPDDVNGVDTVGSLQVYLHKSTEDFQLLTRVDNYHYMLDSLAYIVVGETYYVRVESSEFGNLSSDCQKTFKTPVLDSVVYNEDQTNYLLVYFNNDYPEGTSFYINYLYFYEGVLVSKSDYEKFNPFEVISDIEPGSAVVQKKDIPRFDSLKIELHVISDDLARFLVSQDKYDFTKNDPFYPQTYPVYSNIYGGYGIFASHSLSSFTLIK